MKKCHTKMQWLVWIGIVILHGFCIRVHAQSDVARGAGPPSNDIQARWYWDTLNRAFWDHPAPDVWNKFTEGLEVTSMGYCHGKLVVYTTHSTFLYSDRSNKMIPVGELYCGDSIRITQVYSNLIVSDLYNHTILSIKTNLACPFPNLFSPQTVQSKTAFCMPTNPNSQNFGCDELHYWGILSTQGQWLIEPKFDQYFRFQKGIAEVIYYGQKRKINEKGEFVE